MAGANAPAMDHPKQDHQQRRQPMYVCIIKMADDKAVAAILAARRLSPEAWQVIAELLGESPIFNDADTHSFGMEAWHWAPPDDGEASASPPLDLDDPAGTNNEAGAEGMQ
jgi:hypothetical protein